MSSWPGDRAPALPVVQLGAAPSSILAVHGFGGGAGSFDAVAAHLPLSAVTLPGHDGVPPATFAETAAMLAAATTAKTILWGYSLGARLALAAAALTPLRGLVLESGRADANADDARVALDDARAADLEARGVDAFFADWDNGPLFAHLDARARRQRQQLRRHHDPVALAAVLRNFSPGRTHIALAPRSTPVVLVVGERDAAFRDHAISLQKVLSSSRLFIADGCGHQPHIEDPAATARVVGEFALSLVHRSDVPNLEQRS